MSVTSNQTRNGSKAILLAALVAASLGASVGAQAQTAQLAVDTVGFSFPGTSVSIGGVIQADGLGAGGVTSRTTAINQETYATFILPTLGAGTQFTGADFSITKTNAYNFLFSQPDFSADLVAAAAPASLVAPTDIGQTYNLGLDGTPLTTNAAGDQVDVTPDADITGQGFKAGGAPIISTFGDRIVTTTNGSGQRVSVVVDANGNQVTDKNGAPFAGNADTYHATVYENTVIVDPLYQRAAPGEITFAKDAVGKSLSPLSYRVVAPNFFTPSTYTQSQTLATYSTAGTAATAQIAQFLNDAYRQYGAGSTVTFSLLSPTLADPVNTPPAAYTTVGKTEQLSYAIGPAATAAVPETSSFSLLGLGLLGLASQGLRARRRQSAPLSR